MKNFPILSAYRLLTGSLLVWLLSAWIAQQPTPDRKAEPVSRSTTSEGTNGSRADSTVQHDPESGLAMDKSMVLVKGQCTACHSSKLILQSHFNREKWIERIRWMQRTQKLWDLGESEPAILAYLTKYYGPLDIPFDGRRLPLSAPRWYKQAER